jgi:hypothetical protein
MLIVIVFSIYTLSLEFLELLEQNSVVIMLKHSLNSQPFYITQLFHWTSPKVKSLYFWLRRFESP